LDIYPFFSKRYCQQSSTKPVAIFIPDDVIFTEVVAKLDLHDDKTLFRISVCESMLT